MKKNKLLYTILLTCSLSISAQTTNLKELLNEGLKQNYGIQLSKLSEDISENNVSRAAAGQVPKITINGSVKGDVSSSSTNSRTTGLTTTESGIFNHGASASVAADWTIFDGYKMQAEYARLKELHNQGKLATRLSVETFIADLTTEYYNFIRQKIRLKNLLYAVSLSRERLRIVEARNFVGNAARLDVQQASVDFNADSADCLKQKELVSSANIQLNKLISSNEVTNRLIIRDTLIAPNLNLEHEALLESMHQKNVDLLMAESDKTLSQLDLKKVKSRDYPYFKLGADFGVNNNRYGSGATFRKTDWGPEVGVTVGFNLYDGLRSRDRKNANIAIEQADVKQRNLKLQLDADFADLWQAYQNNIKLLQLEQKNVVTATNNYTIAHERFLLGDLSGIEMREAQKGLLDAQERMLEAEYNTKVCEISLIEISGKSSQYLE